MSYMSDLNFMLRGLDAGALGGDEALSLLIDAREEQDAKRQARKQAMAESQQSSLDSLGSLALGAAGEPTDLEGVMRMFGAQQGFASGNPEDALSQLFLPPEGRNAGLSRIAPTLPGGATEDIANIVKDEWEGGTQDPASIRQTVAGALGFGPKTMGRLSPEIDAAVEDAIKRVRGF